MPERGAATRVHPVQQGFEAIEPVAPEGAVKAHPVDQGRQAVRLGAIVGLASVASATCSSS
jgi:hypothetical protein